MQHVVMMRKIGVSLKNLNSNISNIFEREFHYSFNNIEKFTHLFNFRSRLNFVVFKIFFNEAQVRLFKVWNHFDSCKKQNHSKPFLTGVILSIFIVVSGCYKKYQTLF